MLKFSNPTSQDWKLFELWAKQEGWIVPAFELELYKSHLADAALTVKDGAETCGLVTAIAYQRSGWIGNLIVPKG